MKILITGANGLLGQKLVEQLANDDSVEIIATGRGESRLPESWKVNYMTLDITSEASVQEVFDRIQPDSVIHTAAMTHVDQCELNREECDLNNVQAVQYLVSASEKHRCFFLHLSTDFIFDGTEGPLDEESGNKQPVNYYGLSKLKSEQIVQAATCSWAIARTVLVYGVNSDMSRSNIILWVKNSLESGKPIQVVDDQFRTPTLAEDLAAGCISICLGKHNGIFNISGEEFLTPYQMALQTAEYFGLSKDLITKTDSNHFKQPARRPLKTGFVITKAKNILGYQPSTFLQGIELVAKQIKK